MSQGSAANDARSENLPARGRAPGSGEHQILSSAALHGSRQREQASVQEYFDRFAAAMMAADKKAMLQLWGVPAFVVGVNEARVLQSEDEAAEQAQRFFSEARGLYGAQGFVQTRPEITGLDWVGPDLVIATVRWPYLDENDRVLCEESSSYTLLRGEDGGYKVRAITLRGPAKDPALQELQDGTDGE